MLARQLLNALMMSLLCAGVLAAKVHLHGEPFNERTLLILRLGGLAGAIAALALTPLCAGHNRFLSRWKTAVAFACVFMAAMTLLYVIKYEFLSDQVDHVPELIGYWFLAGLGSTAAYFLAFSPSYLLFWPLPAMMLLAALILPQGPHRKG